MIKEGSLKKLYSLTTCRTGNLTRLVHTLAICVTIHRIAFRVGFSITATIGALVFVRGLFLSVVRCYLQLLLVSSGIRKPR